ncbi:MAG: amidohydrolase family protein [Phycisphaerae bacterium]
MPVRAASDSAPEYAVRAKAFLDAEGRSVEGVVLVVTDGKVSAIGPDVKPPADCVVLDRSEAVLAPGLIDLHATLGTMQKTGEAAHAIESDADAADLFNRFHRDFERAVRAGITTVVLAPSSAHLVGGVTTVVKTAGADPSRRILGRGPLKLSLASEAFTLARPPTSLEGGLDELRRRIAEARGNRDDVSPFARWARGETAAIVDVADANGAALSSLARFAGEEGVKCIALHAKFAAERLDAVKSLGGPLVLGPFSFGDGLRYTRTPALLKEAGLSFALTCDPPRDPPELLRVGAAIAMAEGLAADAALAALTKTPAGIAGVADRVGSLSSGMDADFLVLSGRPTDLSSRILEVFVNGERVYRRPPDPEPEREERR